MSNKAKNRLFDRHFSGKSNSGLRKKIRLAAAQAQAEKDPEAVYRAVMNLTFVVGLNELGRATLKAAAEDYKAVAFERLERSSNSGGLAAP